MENYLMKTNFQTTKQYRDIWLKDIGKFIHYCDDGQRFAAMIPDDPILDLKEEDIKEEEKFSKSQRIQDKNLEEKEKQIHKDDVHNFEKTALKVIDKEMEYEQLFLREEQMREQQENEALAIQIEKEKEKQECVKRNVKKKAEMEKFEIMEEEEKQKVDEIKQVTQKQVEASRSDIYRKIELMRKEQERKRRDALRTVSEIRAATAEEVLKDNKQGNSSVCDTHKSDVETDHYCNHNLPPDNQQLIVDCLRSRVDFCQICCENEFGESFEKQRKDCQRTYCENVFDPLDVKNWTFDPFKKQDGPLQLPTR